MDWCQKKCLQMIDTYKSCACLWDPASEHYKNAARKEDAWLEIASMMQCGVEEVKKKMESLLASYRRERHKTRAASFSAPHLAYTSKWFAFKQMHFLMDKYKPRKALDVDGGQFKNMVDDPESEREDETAILGPSLGTITRAQSLAAPHARSAAAAASGLKRSRPEDHRAKETYIFKDPYEKLSDQSQAFGNHIAAKHREYSKRTRAFVEHHIGRILFEADLGKYDYEQLQERIKFEDPEDEVLYEEPSEFTEQ